MVWALIISTHWLQMSSSSLTQLSLGAYLVVPEGALPRRHVAEHRPHGHGDPSSLDAWWDDTSVQRSGVTHLNLSAESHHILGTYAKYAPVGGVEGRPHHSQDDRVLYLHAAALARVGVEKEGLHHLCSLQYLSKATLVKSGKSNEGILPPWVSGPDSSPAVHAQGGASSVHCSDKIDALVSQDFSGG